MQTLLKQISIDLSRRLGDEAATAATDGVLFTSAKRLEGINGARKLIFSQLLKSMGEDAFLEMYPEFLQLSLIIAKTTTVPTKGISAATNGAGNLYTEATKQLVIATGFKSNLFTDFTNPDVTGYPVMIHYQNAGQYPVFTTVQSVINATTVVLKDAYGLDIPQNKLMAIVLVPGAGYYIKPANCKKVIEVIIPGGVLIKKMSAELYMDAIGNPDTMWPADASNPRFVEHSDGVRLLPDNLTSTIQMNILIMPVDVVLDDTLADIPEISWYEEIIETAAEIILSGQQSS